MRATTAAHLGLFLTSVSACGGVVAQRTDGAGAAGGAGSSDAATGRSPVAAHCRRDADCASAFCDGASCAAPDSSSFYGRACPDGYGRDVGKESLCGAYLCVGGRCRSCTVDSDCGAGAKCYEVPGRPGATCGSQTNPDPSWRPLEWCEVDSDCAATGFCDLHTCVLPNQNGSSYGLSCTGAATTTDTCLGYACVDERCRSCASDSQCVSGKICDVQPDQLGKSCVVPF